MDGRGHDRGAAPSRANGATLALLAVAALINLLLVGVVWSSMAGLGDVVREVGERAALAQSEREPQAEQGPPAWTPTATPEQSEGELALSLSPRLDGPTVNDDPGRVTPLGSEQPPQRHL